MIEHTDLPPKGDRLAGKTAIVTGAGSRGRSAPGIGSSTAILFARQGARVVVAGPERGKGWNDGESDRRRWRRSFRRFLWTSHGEEDCRELAAECVNRYGSLDIVVNNAGAAGSGDVTEFDEEILERGLGRESEGRGAGM